MSIVFGTDSPQSKSKTLYTGKAYKIKNRIRDYLEANCNGWEKYQL